MMTSLVLQVQTHVISSILHIAHEYDSNNEPWPIEIEDNFGVLHSINLEAGQVSVKHYEFVSNLFLIC